VLASDSPSGSGGSLWGGTVFSPKDGNIVLLSIDAENPATRHPTNAVVMNRRKTVEAVVRETIVPEIQTKGWANERIISIRQSEK
jgi:hypothetical protein